MPEVNLAAILADYKAPSEITVLPAGRYTLRFLTVTARATDLMPVYEVVEGRYAGKKVMAGTYGSVKGSDAAEAMWLWQAAGITERFIAEQGTTLSDIAAALTGRTISAEIEIVVFNGEQRNRLVPENVYTTPALG